MRNSRKYRRCTYTDKYKIYIIVTRRDLIPIVVFHTNIVYFMAGDAVCHCMLHMLACTTQTTYGLHIIFLELING